MKQRFSKAVKVVISPAFLILLVTSAILWFITKLSHNYTATIDVEVTPVTDFNSGIWVEQQQPLLVKTLAQGDGRDLILYKLGLGQKINIPVSMLTISQEDDAQPYMFTIDEKSMERALSSEQNKFTILMTTCTIPTVKVSSFSETNLPLISIFCVISAPQYTIKRASVRSPYSMSVNPPLAYLDTLNAVYTLPLELNELRTHTSGVIRLITPPGAVNSVDIVRYTIDVVGYTELSLVVPISQNIDENILTIPTEVKLMAKVPLNNTVVSLQGVRAVIDTKWADIEGKIGRVVIENMPKQVIDWSVEPEFVEVFRINN